MSGDSDQQSALYPHSLEPNAIHHSLCLVHTAHSTYRIQNSSYRAHGIKQRSNNTVILF